ncbi:MAG: hypothetical protein AAF517_25080, partial [Planctomycetota bacterium]
FQQVPLRCELDCPVDSGSGSAGGSLVCGSGIAKKIEIGLKQFSASVAKKVVAERVGIVAAVETSEKSSLPKRFNQLVLQSLLAESVLTIPLSKGKDVDAEDDKGKFSKRKLFSRENVAKYRQLGIEFLVLSTTTESKGKFRVSLEAFELKKLRVVSKMKAPTFTKEDSEAIRSLTLLPKLNVKVLLHAAANYGEQVDRGECWDLPARPLRNAGARPTGYDFGKEVSFEEAKPGDVLTIDNGEHRHVMVLLDPGETLKKSMILHQNWNKKKFVQRTKFPKHYPVEDIKIWRPGK